MDTSLAHENARLRALLQTQQDTIRQMAEYNRLLSQRVAAYASEINRLKALVAKLQRMQFGKSSEKLRAKTERQIQEAQERISALQEEMAETLGEQYDPVLPSALRQSSARKPLPASLPRETRVIRPEEECCPACGGELSSLGCDVSEQLELISSAFKVICVFRSIRSRIGIEVRSAIRIHSINRELNFFYRFLTRFFAAFHYRGIFPQ